MIWSWETTVEIGADKQKIKEQQRATKGYKGQLSEKVLKSFKTTWHRSLPNNIETKVVYTGTKLGSNFQIKDKTKLDHKHDLVYCVKCPACQEDYTLKK